MNQNDKFHGEEFEANARAVSDDELDSVAGGTGSPTTVCPKCGSKVCSVVPPLNYTEPEPRRMCIACDYAEW